MENFISACLGALIGGFFKIVYDLYTKRQQKKKLAAALAAEISELESVLMNVSHAYDLNRPEFLLLSECNMYVFKENAPSLGILSANTVKAVTTFYTRVSILSEQNKYAKELWERYSLLNRKANMTDEERAEVTFRREDVNNVFPIAQRNRQQALHVLNDVKAALKCDMNKDDYTAILAPIAQ